MKELERERGLLAQFIFEHYRLKLLALGLAVALFAFVRLDSEVERVIDWPLAVEFVPVKSDSYLVSPMPATVKVRLRGPRTHVNELKAYEVEPIRIVVAHPGRTVIALDQNMIRVAPQVDVIGIEPRLIQLEWAAHPKAR